MTKKRGFEIVKKYEGKGINLPVRQTKNAAGYDIESAEDFVVPSIWKFGFFNVLKFILNKGKMDNDKLAEVQKSIKPVLVPTGVKAYMQEDEVLILANRSSNPLKRGLAIPNGIGVIDADYYNNESNEGELFVQLINFFPIDYKVKKGERLAQGIFINYLTTDEDEGGLKKRNGGFGSSGI
ncbi:MULTISPECIES: dUTP diphosphatase [Companilactobacillus]|uniref:dUTP diphosphatase n=2 Tax=Companilactobacillus bobalius TaxID=2801451 RepID=A0A202FED2_9LACO|nr:dUTP diphosphatase [Companilactobacillus bobalius]KAE9557129.1 dUTP diphosphatase [Companilactobacillus bobalius]KRK82055.1 deoxyUTP pyrophosphatase [Companilactobacillus bobalius DSM 19674]OVE98792.1 dUTP diphosphatase [Companilactobacillus bobalius]GEO57966.1 dUTP diphosphatase [Companilactobacillus paralimentarius]